MKHRPLEVPVLVEVHLDGYMAHVKKQDGLVKGPERSAPSSSRYFPAAVVLAAPVHCHLMMRSYASAYALFVSVRLKLD